MISRGAARKAEGILPVYKMIDTCAAEFDSYVPYFYSTYEQENESVVSAELNFEKTAAQLAEIAEAQ